MGNLSILRGALASAQVSTYTTGSITLPSARTAFIPPTSFQSISSVTVGSGGAADVTFSSIPATFTHLQIRYIAQSSGYGRIQFNSSTTGADYHSHYFSGNGSTRSAGELPGSTYSSIVWGVNNIGGSGSVFSVGIIDILDYTSTNKNKTLRIQHGVDYNGSGDTELDGALFKATPAAITSIKLFPHAANTWTQHTQFALYGIMGS